MSHHDGFAPIAPAQAKILILGTMPGAMSLQKQEYYAHPRNTFWPIMTELFGNTDVISSYQARQKLLMSNQVALWDVLASCYRPGSLDTNIQKDSIKTNNFMDFFTLHQTIGSVFFNGGMAEKLYQRYVLPVIKPHFSNFNYRRLPSTSPANAGLTFSQKCSAWRVIKESVVK
jgi:hypoxanthine-DNA glycosylase